MNKIGIIGGMTPESTILYYRLLNRFAAEQYGDEHTAQVLINSLDFGMISKYQQNGNWDELNQIMAQAAQDLERAGAKCILIGANTMHLCYEYTQSKIQIPIIHIAEATAETIKEKKIRKVGLLGTKYTMEKDFYKSILSKHGIETIIPKPQDRETIHTVIYQELARGIFSGESKQIYLSIMQQLNKQGAEGMVLGCTEIPLLISSEDTSQVLFNTTEIHAKKAMEIVS